MCWCIGLLVFLRKFLLAVSGVGRSGRTTSMKALLLEGYIIRDSDLSDFSDAAASRISRGNFEHLAM